MGRIAGSVLACCFAGVCLPAYAHRPTLSDGTAVDALHAVAFDDVQISRVVYHEASGRAPRLWITFEIDRPQDLLVQIGVPMLDRLATYRPTLVLLGPGLPVVPLPFESPSGLGGRILDTRDVATPKPFYEPFTRTRSWILREQDVRLPEAGRYYVVAYAPDAKPGKLWVALGRKEDWGARDLLNMPRILADVRRFHEVGTGELPMPSAPHLVVFDFHAREAASPWISVNDGVMGGVSEGSCRITDDGVLEFAGVVSLENNGGFASIRSRPGQHDLSEYDALLIRVRGDGQRYACNLRTDFEIRAGAYQQRFDTKKDEWQEIVLPLRDFVATSFGRGMPDAPRLDASKIRSFGFTISDKQEGPFRLEVKWIRAVRTPREATSKPAP